MEFLYKDKQYEKKQNKTKNTPKHYKYRKVSKSVKAKERGTDEIKEGKRNWERDRKEGEKFEI